MTWPAAALALGVGTLAALSVAYRRLFLIDPDASIPGTVGGLEGWFFSPLGNSPAFVVAVSVLLAYMRFPSFRASLGDPARPGLSLIFALGSLAFFTWAQYVAAYYLLLPSLTLFCLAASAWVGGSRALKAASVPALFLLFAFPLPGVLVNHWVYPLQRFAAEGATWVLSLAGWEVVKLGDRIFTTGHIFQVIESCSGLRAMETLTLAAVIYCQLFPRAFRHALLIVAGAPLLGLLINLVRVLSIILNPFATDLRGTHRPRCRDDRRGGAVAGRLGPRAGSRPPAVVERAATRAAPRSPTRSQRLGAAPRGGSPFRSDPGRSRGMGTALAAGTRVAFTSLGAATR